jgi:hypothetical protein
MLLTHAKFKELKTLFSVSLSKFVRIATPKVARAKAKHTRTPREMLTESNCSANQSESGPSIANRIVHANHSIM